MRRYLFDTNVASAIIKGNDEAVRRRLVQVPIESLLLSVVSEAEMHYGLAKRGHPVGLSKRVNAFLDTVTVLSWTTDVAASYGRLRDAIERDGLALSPLDLMIAAHALSEGATLVTRDRAFEHVSRHVDTERWDV